MKNEQIEQIPCPKFLLRAASHLTGEWQGYHSGIIDKILVSIEDEKIILSATNRKIAAQISYPLSSPESFFYCKQIMYSPSFCPQSLKLKGKIARMQPILFQAQDGFAYGIADRDGNYMEDLNSQSPGSFPDVEKAIERAKPKPNSTTVNHWGIDPDLISSISKSLREIPWDSIRIDSFSFPAIAWKFPPSNDQPIYLYLSNSNKFNLEFKAIVMPWKIS